WRPIAGRSWMSACPTLRSGSSDTLLRINNRRATPLNSLTVNHLTHDALLFNVHDLVLLMAAGQYVLLALLLLFTPQGRDKSSVLLASILLITALQSLNNLFVWSDPLRQMVLAWHPNGLLLGS